MKRHVIVVGGGIAGASAALRLADAGVAVTLFTKTPLAVSASQWAQGGIAAALAADDDWRAHARDTLDAGAGLADAGAARHSAAAAPAMIAWLEGLGIAFTRRRDGKALHLTREAGHGARRIVHADDATGAAVMRVLLERVAAHPRVATLTGHTVIDLLLRDDDAVAGVKTLDPHSGHVAYRGADQVVLACGGAAGLYARSTSAGGATGDGIAMAWRAGCRVANLEYVQFHPTCLHVDAPGQPPLLISEAVRGEGGVLRRADGTRFMPDYHAAAELACRDVVARAIVAELARSGDDCVYLDVTHLPAAAVRRRFPAIHARCLALGLDMTQRPLPVAPAAHYTCGGIVTGRTGTTDVDGLYAIGECAFTGLHGANRLASNSLLEGLVGARDVTRHLLDAGSAGSGDGADLTVPQVARDGARAGPTAQDLAAWAAALAATMTDRVGIVRTLAGLREALATIDALAADAAAAWRDAPLLLPARAELANGLCVARLIARSALKNPGSRGAHYNADRPDRPAAAIDTVLTPDRRRPLRAA